ncbi:MAG: hypothetical protein U9N52_12040 [Campylobacterota bacterium]|nr:hypothetical protein [Campylobacterota bacterium]
MVEDKLLFITEDDKFLLFDGVSFSPVKAKKSKNYSCGALVSASSLRSHGMRVPANIAPEKLEIQSEMTMYEEAGLDPETDFKIASVGIVLEDDSDQFVESYAIENEVLNEKFAKNASKLKHIDYIVPSFLRYGALYVYEKLERKNDVFIYLGEDEAYAVMYKNGEYISTRTILTLNELSEKLEMGLPALKTLLSTKGIDNDLYPPDEFLKMTLVQEEFSKIAERISHAISHKRGIFGLDSIDRFYIDFEGKDIPGFLPLFENYGFEGATFSPLKVFDDVEPEHYADALGALYIIGIIEEKYPSANLSIFERSPAFYKSHAGIFLGVLSAGVIAALAYPVYGTYELNALESERMELQGRVDAMNALTTKLQKKLKEVRLERKRLEGVKGENIATIESYDELVDTLKAERSNKKRRQKMMQDVNQAMAHYKLSSRNLDQNGSDRMHVHIISEFEKRDDIAKFMKELIAQGYLHVNTREIRREENLYESIIEIRP